VGSNATLSVQFSSAVAAGSPHPKLNPPIAGHWASANPDTLVFVASAPLVPGSSETITVPGGPSGARALTGEHLAHTVTASFTVADGSTHRLQELLAQLGYLPLAYVPPTPAPAGADLAEPQPGPLTWRWNMPNSLSSLWLTGSPNIITKAAVMSFERQNGLAVDGVAGPQVWKTLLADVTSGKGDATPYSYVFVSKTLPETLTLYVNGAVKYGGVLVNTGAPGATTLDGTFPVFEHVVASDMKGTNITGSTYNDPTVPWASYFNGGDALHGFVRSHYGYPQSNGCVEMPIDQAALVWPYTPVGTLVTVVGLPNTPPKTPATTTTTAPTPSSTTTSTPPPAAPPTTTTTAPPSPPPTG
jgi:peptidoglycan hydrolase-like protein with peptidoglycan-binding domain